ncbi:Os07g0620950, partial [Oryza sativa Japonica Group]
MYIHVPDSYREIKRGEEPIQVVHCESFIYFSYTFDSYSPCKSNQWHLSSKNTPIHRAPASPDTPAEADDPSPSPPTTPRTHRSRWGT